MFFGNGCVFVVVPSSQCISQMVFLNCNTVDGYQRQDPYQSDFFMHFWEAHEQVHLFRKMKRIVLGGRQVCRNMMERTFTCSFACKTRSKRGGGLQKGARSLYVQYHLYEQPPSFVGKRKIITCKMLSNVEKQDWNEAGGRPFACLWSLWSHTKSNRPLIWWLRPWKSSPPSEEDVRGRAWSFSRQREGSSLANIRMFESKINLQVTAIYYKHILPHASKGFFA